MNLMFFSDNNLVENKQSNHQAQLKRGECSAL